ncbi:MAG: maleylpyruvate isomerase N-terminal domain-containing protein [Streptosporangiaceae bacterium]
MSSPAAGPGRLASGPALEAIYGQLADVAHGLTEASALQPSRCAGWARMDVLYHQLMDARRALVTFATPAQGEPDTDAVSYWRPFSPGSDDPAAPDADSAARHARHVRIVASAYPVSFLAGEWRETSAAAVRAARSCPYPVVGTQGLALSTDDFIATLVTEATVHYLDLTVGLPDAPPPDPAGLAIVRRVLEGLAGAPLPADWDDVTCALKGTGRLPAGPQDSVRLPLLT